jgi:cell wall-associated NlpC family hydrolase
LFNVDDLINVPFVPGGRDPEVGLDCYGLCLEAARRLGWEIPSIAEFLPEKPLEEDLANIDRLILSVAASGNFIEISRPEPPCFVLFYTRPPLATHIGVMLSEKEFIHTRRKAGTQKEKISSPLWSWRVKGFYTWAT